MFHEFYKYNLNMAQECNKQYLKVEMQVNGIK